MIEYRDGVGLDDHSFLKEYIRYLQHAQYGDEAVIVELRKKKAS